MAMPEPKTLCGHGPVAVLPHVRGWPQSRNFVATRAGGSTVLTSLDWFSFHRIVGMGCERITPHVGSEERLVAEDRTPSYPPSLLRIIPGFFIFFLHVLETPVSMMDWNIEINSSIARKIIEHGSMGPFSRTDLFLTCHGKLGGKSRDASETSRQQCPCCISRDSDIWKTSQYTGYSDS